MTDDLIFAIVLISFLMAIGAVLALAAALAPRRFFEWLDPTWWDR